MTVTYLRPWHLLAILVGLHLLSFLDRFIILLMVDPIRAQFGVSDVQIGLLHGAAFGVFYATFGIPLGWLADKMQRRLIICGGVLVWSAATFASGLAQNFNQLFVARLFVGAGEAALVPAALSMLGDAFPRERLATAAAIFAAAVPVGAASALALGGVLIEAVEGMALDIPWGGVVRDWQLAFLLLGAPGIIFAFVIFLVPEPRKQDRADLPSNQIRLAFSGFFASRWTFLVPAFLAGGFSAMLGNGIFAWLPTHLNREFDWSPAQIGISIGLTTALFGALGSAGSGFIVDRWFAQGRLDAHVRYYAFSLALVGVLAILAFRAPSAVTCLMLFAGVSLLQQFYGVVGAAVQLVTPPELRGRVSAIYLFSYNVMGVGLGPVAVATISNLGPGGSLRIADGVIVLAMICTPLCSGLFFLAGPAMVRLLKGSTKTPLSDVNGARLTT